MGQPHKFYKPVNKKKDAWEEIAKQVGISVPEVKKKMNNGRNWLFRHFE